MSYIIACIVAGAIISVVLGSIIGLLVFLFTDEDELRRKRIEKYDKQGKKALEKLLKQK